MYPSANVVVGAGIMSQCDFYKVSLILKVKVKGKMVKHINIFQHLFCILQNLSLAPTITIDFKNHFHLPDNQNVNVSFKSDYLHFYIMYWSLRVCVHKRV